MKSDLVKFGIKAPGMEISRKILVPAGNKTPSLTKSSQSEPPGFNEGKMIKKPIADYPR